ncbi:hypothetical protein HMJ29_10780 [Hymenobacter taeanensis]|uniref:Uncharacterized protein n=1 Tax=Hymenobacter taeanensis TaxID=2735321 RepID=A0A6M6BGP1_9BACT|nr:MULTISPECIES: hypothetical protein [Hymenobacter]QJX47397.1 hypothetical protein HMJ29_10780 [Hymenobacter taeanensis]UOQ79264.1 hypothetical protein MUN83_10330 [Hymenobacter sp. 5414T-23]
MKKTLLFSLLMVVGFGTIAPMAVAQTKPAAFPAPGTYNQLTPDPTQVRQAGGKVGAFQDLEGHWHAVQIGDYTAYKVYMNTGGNTYQAFLPREIKAFVKYPGDTLLSLTGLASHSKLSGGVFGLQQFRGAGVQLVDYRYTRRSLLERLVGAPALAIRQEAGPWQEVPRSKSAFQQLFLVLLADDAAAVAELKTGRPRPGQDAVRLLTHYADFRVTQQLRLAGTVRP